MKKIYLFLAFIMLTLTLFGCSEVQESTVQTASPATEEVAQSVVETSGFELALGTIRLEDTELAVDASQAHSLAPLWQAYATLSQSDITAQAELDAVLRQIKAAMTPEQLALIDSWELSAQDMQAVLDDFGIEFGRGSGEGAGQGLEFAERPEGFVPGQGQGGGPGMGGGMGGGGNPGAGAVPPEGFAPGADAGSLDAEVVATLEAERAQRRADMDFLPLNLINALIEMLQSKSD